ncbi:O-antigen ligase family protein [Pontibacter korlensis]|uniref:O-antigen ligase-related domain-containing protein n=1 Tax=Pontibacter korlensis TaxID=400092 RepID=A0A0E3ZFR9_9BACT|nr:O-antigen ligase family protein [Pontibacter korlensis]AKD04454.1 hypothetical protein PKOR_16855 [Pontibacter korlensis]
MRNFIKKLNGVYLIQQGYYYSLILLAVSLFSPKQIITNIAVLMLALFWMLNGNVKEKYRLLSRNPSAISFFVLFVLYCIGVLYTENIQEGIKSLETKASLLVFPLILGSSTIKREHLYKTVLIFAFACVVLSMIALIYQTFVVIEKDDFNYFFSDGLVSIYAKQAVYFALYVATSILLLCHHLYFLPSETSAKQRLIIVVSILFLLLILFLLASRATQIVLFTILVTSVIVIGVKKGRILHSSLLVAALIAFVIGLSLLFPQTLARFKSLTNISYEFSNTSDIYHFSGSYDDNQWNGLNLRLAKWVCAVDVIKEHPIAGVGTGDVKEAMVQSYKNRKFVFAAQNRFDPHNQYLETAVSIGIAGLVVLLICYFLPLFNAIRYRSWLLITFLLLIISSSLTESILSRSQGATFSCFFLFLLLQYIIANKPYKQ